MNVSPSIVEQLADFVCNLSVRTIPQSVLKEAKRCIVDTIGVMVAGQSATVTKAARQLAISTYAGGNARVSGYADGLHPVGAGTSGHAHDFDDTSYSGIMHGSVVVLPAALALAEQQGVSGEILLEAFIAGVEVEYAVAELCTNHIYFKGWWTSSVYGTFGAAAAGAKILGLDDIHIANAISMATCFTSGMKVSFGTDAKPLGIGMAASKGLQCALLSASGLTAPTGVFEDERGFFTLLNDNKQTLETDLKLSEKWRLTDPGILFKSYPVCSAAQAGTEMTGILMQRHHLTSDDIESVICEVPPLVKMSLIYDQPASIRQAQFSMPFSIGCMLAYGKLGLKQLAGDVLYDSRLQKQMQKVVMEVPAYMANDPTVMERFPEGASITLLTHNQGSVKDFLGQPTGMPGNPITTEDLVVKFVACVTYGGLSAQSAALVADQLLELETIPNIRELHAWFA